MPQKNTIFLMKNSSLFKGDIPPTMLLPSQFINLLNLQKKCSSLQESLFFLPNPFDTVGYSMLLKKLKLYGITDRYLAWFKGYLSNRKQYIQIGENSKAYQICYLQRLPKIYYWTASVSSICNRPAKSISMILIFFLMIRTLNSSFQL